MSILTPKPFQKFAYTTVLDRKFRVKYGLTYAQTEIMSYLVMIIQSWKNIIVIDGYFVILTSKIKNDLLLGEKTIEASITKLKKLGLIETTLVKVPEWKSNENFRGVKITQLGAEYSLSHYKPKLKDEMMELQKRNEELEFKYQSLLIQEESEENIHKKAIEALKREAQKDKEIMLLKAEVKELERKLEISMEKESEKGVSNEKKEKNLEDFRKKITTKYSKSGEPICNVVCNQDAWGKEVQFYINSYNKLSIYTAQGLFQQIANPKEIENFWLWLFAHQHRVGKLLDTKTPPNISHLLKYIGESVVINKTIFKIYNIEPLIGGVKVQLKNKDGHIIMVNSEFGSEVIDINRFEDWVVGVILSF